MKVIGRLEKVHFPELQLENISAKIDTGAYSSSLHCHHIVKETHDDRAMVRFELLDPDHPDYQEVAFLLPVYKEKKVKSSTGKSQKRIFIQTSISVLGETYTVELSLTNRKAMKYPVLIGRKLLKNRFVVDVSKEYISETQGVREKK
ncbi:MAG: RimK/LysX family protein [Spirochaetota bacterium]|nr:RimK/LysX family protein [Spirochaetota bacterium]